MNPEKRRQIFERFRAAEPHPKSELAYRTPYELLVAVVLSAQATDKGVNKATAKLFPVAATPAAIVALGVDGLIPYVQSIGLFRNKAKNVVALSEILVREHGGKVPATRDALEALPIRVAQGNVGNIRLAKWTIARGLRATGKLDDAEKIQLALVAETEKGGEPDGYVYEELAEIAIARGDKAAAAPWAAKAYALLKDDGDLKANEAARLTRLADLAKPASALR